MLSELEVPSGKHTIFHSYAAMLKPEDSDSELRAAIYEEFHGHIMDLVDKDGNVLLFGFDGNVLLPAQPGEFRRHSLRY